MEVESQDVHLQKNELQHVGEDTSIVQVGTREELILCFQDNVFISQEQDQYEFIYILPNIPHNSTLTNCY